MINLFKKVVAVIITITIAMSVAACGAKKKTRYEAEFLGLFDTLTKIVAYTDSKDEFTKYSQLIHG